MEGEGLVGERGKKKQGEKGGFVGEIEHGDSERKRFSEKEGEVGCFEKDIYFKVNIL